MLNTRAGPKCVARSTLSRERNSKVRPAPNYRLRLLSRLFNAGCQLTSFSANAWKSALSWVPTSLVAMYGESCASKTTLR